MRRAARLRIIATLTPLPPLLQDNLAMRKIDPALVLFLTAAFLSFLLSVHLWFFVSREYALFVGLWVPSILSLGALVRGG